MMQIEIVPCLRDNYAYLIRCDATGEVAIVDAPERDPIADALDRLSWRANELWLTHHHLDHVGGARGLVDAGVRVVRGFRGDAERLPCVTNFADDGDRFRLGSLEIEVLHVPGHTLGAIAFWACGEGGEAVFTGDTLFASGCGRMFEGNPEMMHRSLARLAALPGATKVYPGHEYTEQNLVFARAVEGSHPAIVRYAERVRALRSEGRPSVGTSIDDERAVNPFLRTGEARVRAYVESDERASASEVFGRLRAAKDEF